MFMAGPAQQMPTAKETSRESGSNQAEFTGQSDRQTAVYMDRHTDALTDILGLQNTANI